MEDRTIRNEDFELWVLLRHTVDAMLRAREKELRKTGISRIQSAVLFIVKNIATPATPLAISRRLLREPHSTSELLSRMAKKGLVKKVKDLEMVEQQCR